MVGRKPFDIWELSEKVPPPPGRAKPDAVCKACQKVIKHAQPGRDLVPHVMYCSATPVEPKYKYLSPFIRQEVGSGHQTKKRRSVGASDEEESGSVFECTGCRECSCPCVCGARNGSASLPAELLKSLQLALARFIFSAGIAFRIVENYRFRAFIRMMCPAFVFPARDRVSNALMATAHEEEKALVIAALERPPHLSLVTDAWRNRSGESTINYMLVSPVTKPVLWTSYDDGRRAAHGGLFGEQDVA